VAIEHGDDRRVRTLTITSKGHQTAIAALPYWRTAQRALAGELSDALASLSATTDRLISKHARRREQRGSKEMTQ
jgi:hypothetical protein